MLDDLTRCRGVTNRHGFIALGCATCLRRKGWREDHENGIAMTVMEPAKRASECEHRISPRKEPRDAR